MRFGLNALHLLAAMIWFGGMFHLGAVVIPALRRDLEESERTRWIPALGRRFRPFAWSAVLILWITGGVKVYELTAFRHLGSFLQHPHGRILGWKVTLALAATVLAFLHDWVLGPRYQRGLESGNLPPSSRKRLRRWTVGLAVATQALILAVILLAVMLHVRAFPPT